MTRPESAETAKTWSRSLLASPEFEDWLREEQASSHARRILLIVDSPPRLDLSTPWEHAVAPEHGALPYQNRSIDLVVVIGATQLVAPAQLSALLREGWRVAARALAVLEPDSGALSAARMSRVLAEVTEQQADPTHELGLTRWTTARSSRDDAPTDDVVTRRLRNLENLCARMRGELSRTQNERDAARRRVTELEASLPRKLSENGLARRLVLTPARRLGARITRVQNELRARGVAWPASFTDDPPEPTVEEDLPFAGVATRARPNDPEEFMRARPNTVAVCHPHWRGIRAATYEQTRFVVEAPGFTSERQAMRLAGYLNDCGVQRIVINGFPPGTEHFVRAIAKVSQRTETSIVYHGTPALSYGEDVVLQWMLQLFDEGKLRKLGFVKHGLAEYFRFRGARAEWVMNRCTMEPSPPARVSDGSIRVGVFAPSASHKNVETQLVAALLVPGAEVHTIEPVRTAYLMAESHRLHSHGLKPRPEFLELLRTMHAATYVSLVECYPMTVLESILSGVICVTSNTSLLFDDDAVLRQALVVPHHDSPAAIAAKLSSAIEKREELIPRAQAHLQKLNERAEQRWNEFLDD